jgi:signal transduction histidine kinase
LKRWRSVRVHHVLFAVTLAALAALGGWWTVFFRRAVDAEKEAALFQMIHVTVVTALTMGQQEQHPPVGRMTGRIPMQVIHATDRKSGDLSSPLVPRHRSLYVRPDPEAVEDLERRASRRRVMFMGEGGLLFALLGICAVMLFRLWRAEQGEKRRMEAFFSAATHEMKTPLAGLKSVLQTFAAGNVPRGQEPLLYAMSLKETERLEHLVENVLISGRLRSDVYRVHDEPVPLRPFLEKFVEHRRRYLVGREDAVRLSWDAEEPEVVACCDRNALMVVMENLVDNAFKYGGDSPTVTVRVRRADKRVLLSVEDRGIGFDPAVAETLFDPFRRGDDDKGGVQHGTGLGLAITGELVTRMGGTVKAHSDGPGQGASFRVTLREARS